MRSSLVRAALRVALLLPLCLGLAHAAPAHVHGQGNLEIALDGAQLSLHLESPLHDLIGFERAPRNAAEQQKVRDMAARLRAADRLFLPTAAAGCTLQSVSLVSAVLDPALLGEAGKAGGDSDGHADLDADFSFRCDKPEVLQGLKVALFGQFPGLHRLQASFAGPRGQKAARLDAANPELRW
ncbi:DUF2796 domain-containing protein [Uliginosibacterium paludis]|uniref:DUF2796 domain-containing protein n=1 Tax=Uliginosibacterium paludis TaxID=1615952 RepID=A0ABV2CU67_9RHOO